MFFLRCFGRHLSRTLWYTIQFFSASMNLKLGMQKLSSSKCEWMGFFVHLPTPQVWFTFGDPGPCYRYSYHYLRKLLQVNLPRQCWSVDICDSCAVFKGRILCDIPSPSLCQQAARGLVGAAAGLVDMHRSCCGHMQALTWLEQILCNASS